MKTKNYLLGALLIPAMMLATSGAIAGEHGNEEADERDAERAEEQRDDRPDQDDIYMSSKPDDAFYAKELIGADVKSPAVEDEDIGSLRDLIIDEEGQIKGIVIGVGGWLGIGEKNIALEWDSVELTKDDEGDYVIRVDVTEEALEGAPEFEYE